MESHPTAPLERPLSADQHAAVNAFYKPDLGTWLGLGVFLPLLLGWMTGMGYGVVTGVQDLEALLPVGFCGGVAALVLAQLLLRWNSRRKMARAEFIYQYGQPESITFVGLTTEGHGKNSRPRTVIHLLRGVEPLKIKTTDDRIVASFMPPQQVVYTHPTYPDVLVPGSLFAPGWATGPRAKPREMEV